MESPERSSKLYLSGIEMTLLDLYSIRQTHSKLYLSGIEIRASVLGVIGSQKLQIVP